MTDLVEEKSAPGMPAGTSGQPGPLEAVRPALARETRDIATISRGVVAYNFGYLALVWAVALGAIALFWVHTAWYTFALAFLIVSSRHQALLNIEHECIHGKFVSSRRWNDLIGRWLCGAAVGSPFSASRERHLSHHRLLATPEDPDRNLHSGETKRTRWGLVKHFIGGLLGGYAGMVLMGPRVPRSQSDKRSAAQDLLSLVVVQGIIAAGFTLVLAWWIYPALWLAPLATVTVLFHLVRSFVEHAITGDEERAHANRLITIHSNGIERGLVAPYNMNYHAEHHILPSVPAPRLKQLRHRLAGRDGLPPVLDRPSYGRALLHYARSLRD